jgi:hypothetical protein
MRVDLTEQERDELITVVEGAVAKLPTEIHHTDSREFRKRLHEREETLTSVLERLRSVDE